MVDLVKSLIAREPLVVLGIAASAVVVVAGKLGIILDQASVKDALEPILVAVVGRQFVSPAKKK